MEVLLIDLYNFMGAEAVQFLKEIEDNAKERISDLRADTRGRSRTSSRPTLTEVATEHTALLDHQSALEGDRSIPDISSAPSIAGGTVLGIHNLAIVFPQFIVRLVHPYIIPLR